MDSVSRDSPKPPGARLRRFARSLLRVFLTAFIFGYALLAIVLYCMQDRMIFSGQRTQGLASSVVHPPAGTELVRLRTAQGDGTVALFGPVTRLPIVGAGHNDIFAVGGNDLWRSFGKFLNGL